MIFTYWVSHKDTLEKIVPAKFQNVRNLLTALHMIFMSLTTEQVTVIYAYNIIINNSPCPGSSLGYILLLGTPWGLKVFIYLVISD